MTREKYKQSGVDIDAGQAFVEAIKPICKDANRPEVISGIGGFAGLFALPAGRWKNPVLVSGTDGVGTKLLIALESGKLDAIGIDLVAMCVNDVIVVGAEPLFFLDYFAVGKLTAVDGPEIIRGIVQGCRQAKCALLGGETAEMPGLYKVGDFDLAGFAVGVVERDEIIDRSGVRVGDAIIGLASSGIHSNGFSLIRKILFQDHGFAIDEVLPELGRPLQEVLLEPTRIYVQAIQSLRKIVSVHAMCHITGGGFFENVPRSLPEDVSAHFQIRSWPKLPIFPLLQRLGEISDEEMFSVLNCGIGYIAVVPAEQARTAVEQLEATGYQAWQIGEIRKRGKDEARVVLEGL